MSRQAIERSHEQKAERVLRYLKHDIRYAPGHLPRPFFIEITGSPDSGKTTTIREMYNSLRKLGFRVLIPQEGAEVIQHIERTTPVYNVRTAMYALCILLDEAHKHTYDIIFLDRGLFDPFVWMEDWHDLGELSTGQKNRFQQFFLDPLWVNLIDCAFFMVCESSEAMRRGQRIAPIKREGMTSNPAKIKKLVDLYRAAYCELKPTYGQLELVDTTRMGEQEMVDVITDLVLSTLDGYVAEMTKRQA